MSVSELAHTYDEPIPEVCIAARMFAVVDRDSGDIVSIRIACGFPDCSEQFKVENGLGMLAVEAAMAEFTQHWLDLH